MNVTSPTPEMRDSAPASFSAADAFPADPKLLGDDDGRVAQVAVYGDLATLIQRELGDEAIDTTVPVMPDRTVFAVSYSNIDAFRSWLLGLGTHAEVLGPPDLRQTIVQWLTAMTAAAAS